MGVALGTRLGRALDTQLGTDLTPRDAFTGTPDTIIAGAAQKARYRADTGITLNGSRVSGWSNMWANGADLAQATASSQPLYSATGMNGRAMVTADDASRFMTSAVLTSSVPAGRAYLWVFCRISSTPASTRYVATIGRGTLAPRLIAGIGSSGGWLMAGYDGTLSASGGADLATGTVRHLVEAGFTVSTAETFVISGKKRSGVLGASNDVMTTVYLSAITGVANQAAAASVSEIVLMAGEPTAQQKADMRRYFQTYYGTI